MMTNNIGYIFALFSALSFALGTIFFKKIENSKNAIHPFILNFFKNIIGFLIISFVLFFFQYPII